MMGMEKMGGPATAEQPGGMDPNMLAMMLLGMGDPLGQAVATQGPPADISPLLQALMMAAQDGEPTPLDSQQAGQFMAGPGAQMAALAGMLQGGGMGGQYQPPMG